MSKMIWMTDIHLNVLGDNQIKKWLRYVKRCMPANIIGVCITGDITEAPFLEEHLALMSSILDVPIYYVLGNHDYWHSSFNEVENKCKKLRQNNDRLVWLGSAGVIQLSDSIALVGHDGWYDARNGCWEKSSYIMNDWVNVYNFHPFIAVNDGNGIFPVMDVNAIVNVARFRADAGSQYVYDQCKLALRAGNKRVIVLTHFPPFAEAARHHGSPTEDEAIPWYSSQIMGTRLLQLASEFPTQEISVFCGHTHDAYRYVASKNLEVFVGHSQYGNPHWELFSLGE